MPRILSAFAFCLSVFLSTTLAVTARAEAVSPSPLLDEMKKASAAYAAAFNTGDFTAMADQWTPRAELVEGGSRLEGRDTIVASIKAWRARHPESTLEVELREVELVAEPVARVSGVMRFKKKPGDKGLESRFTGLRVKEGTVWRIAESKVTPAHAAALDDLEWLVGTWRAEGFFEWDGTSFEKVMSGTPSDAVRGRVAHWVQTISPTGEGRATTHMVERSIDGVALPDAPPMHFKKIR